MAYCKELLRLRANPLLSQDETAILDLGLRPRALVWAAEEALYPQGIIDLSESLDMLRQGLGVDQDVVNASATELPHVLEDVVHGLLEGRGSVAEPERHHALGEGAVFRTECRTLDVVRVYPDLVESGMQVELGEVRCISNSIKHFVDAGERVLVYHGQLVDRAVVHDHAQLPASLGDE